MSRWEVYKAGRNGWIAHRKGELPPPVEGLRPTWREAMDYADKEARTIEVVLPSQPLPLSLPGDEGDKPITVTQDEEGCVFLTDEDDGEMVVLYPHELHPLVLALLALHYQQEVNQ